MKRNEFELVGRLNYISSKTTTTGYKITRILLSKKGKGQDKDGKDVYNTFPVTFFGELAEAVESNYAKGEYVHVVGYLMPQSYKDKNGVERNEMGLNGSSIESVVYDEKAQDYVVNNATKAETKAEAEEDEEFPF